MFSTPPNPNYRQVVRAIEVPSLLVIGVQQAWFRLMLPQSYNGLIRDFKLNKFRKVGHGLHYDQPERFALVVKSFLRSIDTVIVP